MWFQKNDVLASAHLDALLALSFSVFQPGTFSNQEICLGQDDGKWLWIDIHRGEPPKFCLDGARPPQAACQLNQLPWWTTVLDASPELRRTWDGWLQACAWAASSPCIEKTVWMFPPDARATTFALVDYWNMTAGMLERELKIPADGAWSVEALERELARFLSAPLLYRVKYADETDWKDSWKAGWKECPFKCAFIQANKNEINLPERAQVPIKFVKVRLRDSRAPSR